MDGNMAMTQSEAPMKMTFEPVVAPGSLDDCFAELEYRISHGFEKDWMQDESVESMHFDAVVRVETRPQQPQLPPTQPQIPTFEGNAQWLEILLKACAPPGSDISLSKHLRLCFDTFCCTLANCLSSCKHILGTADVHVQVCLTDIISHPLHQISFNVHHLFAAMYQGRQSCRTGARPSLQRSPRRPAPGG